MSVPVLSEQMQEVEPRVSTHSNFFTKTFFCESLLAVNPKATVTVANNPSGTNPTTIPIANRTLVITVYPKMNPKQKKMIPTVKAMEAIILMKTFNYFLRTVSSSPEDAANPAIYPITVLSPVNTTTPLPLPSLHNVPKKAKFFVSKGFSG